MMENDGWNVTQKILNIALDIICLLTGEDHTTVKKTSSEQNSSLKRCSGTQSPIIDNEQKVLELTNKIIELLTGEVPVRCQDVTVYFSMEEWEYIEAHKDLYQDIMMDSEEPDPLDGSNEKSPAHEWLSPLNSQDCSEDIRKGMEDEGMANITVEVRRQEEEMYMNNDHLCKEEETPIYINKDGHYSSTDAWDTSLYLPQSCKIEDNIVTDSLQHPISPVMHQVHHCTDLTAKSSNYMKCSKNMKNVLKPSAGRRNSKTFECSVCCKTFTQNADLIRHSRVHTGERPFLCAECGKCFTQKSALVYHKRIHTGERPFLCFDCGKCFAHKSILINHRRVHTGEKPYSCTVCGKCFAYKSYLVDHQRIHAGEKPHRCIECRKCFTHKSDLNRHRRVHTGEKRFSCSECGENFTQRANLAMHQKVHLEKQ
ncbi:oocyte zinc finger protein XlCOF7.1-like isoform X2 [Dendropsophus ebraccatus]